MEKDIMYYFLTNCNFVIQVNSKDGKITFYGLSSIYPYIDFNTFKSVWEKTTNSKIVALFKQKKQYK